jgi:putative transcriptional regulator
VDEVAEDVSGRAPLVRRSVGVPDRVDVQAIREKLGLSQAEFARTYRFSIATVRNWEQHRREPDGAAKVLLAVIDRAPEAVRRALSERRT